MGSPLARERSVWRPDPGSRVPPVLPAPLSPKAGSPFPGRGFPGPHALPPSPFGARCTWHPLPRRRAQQRQPEPQHQEPQQRAQQTRSHGERPAGAAVCYRRGPQKPIASAPPPPPPSGADPSRGPAPGRPAPPGPLSSIVRSANAVLMRDLRGPGKDADVLPTRCSGPGGVYV